MVDNGCGESMAKVPDKSSMGIIMVVAKPSFLGSHHYNS